MILCGDARTTGDKAATNKFSTEGTESTEISYHFCLCVLSVLCALCAKSL
jgi:hypothetical protein